MRLLATLGIILALILGLGFWTNYSLQRSTNELSQKIDRISKAVEGNQWETAEQQTGKLEKSWAQKARWWPIFLDHQEMDNIEFSLAKVKEYVASHDSPLSRGQLSELKLMIEHIPRKEEINLENIL